MPPECMQNRKNEMVSDPHGTRVASAVNAELTQLYWQIGRRINSELLQGQRAEYGKQVIAELARMFTTDFGKGWSERQLRYCLRVADIFELG